MESDLLSGLSATNRTALLFGNWDFLEKICRIKEFR